MAPSQNELARDGGGHDIVARQGRVQAACDKGQVGEAGCSVGRRVSKRGGANECAAVLQVGVAFAWDSTSLCAEGKKETQSKMAGKAAEPGTLASLPMPELDKIAACADVLVGQLMVPWIMAGEPAMRKVKTFLDNMELAALCLVCSWTTWNLHCA